MFIYYFYIVIAFVLYYSSSNKVMRVATPEGYKMVKKVPDIVVYTMGFLLFLILALRGVSVGTDTPSYYDHYLYDEQPDWRLGLIAGQEILFRYLELGCRAIGLPWQLFLTVVSILIVVPIIYYFKRYSVNVWASLLIYITIGLFTMNLSGMRQSIAISFVLLAIMQLYEKHLIRYAILVLVGACFHYSALFLLLLIFVYFLKFKHTRQLTLLLFLPVIARVAGDVFFSQLSSYMPVRYESFEEMDATMNPILEIMQFTILLFCYFSLVINKNLSKLDFFLFFMVVLYVTSIELSHTVYMAGRLAYYFEMPVAVAIPNFISKFKDSSNKMFLSMAIYGLCLLAFIVASYGSNTLGYNEYKFFWE